MSEAHARSYLQHLEAGQTRGFAAQAAGLSRFQLCRYRRLHPWFRTAEDDVLTTTIEAVEDALYVQAVSGNVGAAIFWLKNRAPDKWQDRAVVAATVDAPANLVALVQLVEQQSEKKK